MRASSTHKGSSYSSVAALPSVTGASAEAHVTNASGIYRGLKNKKASCLTDGIIYLIQQGADPLAEDDHGYSVSDIVYQMHQGDATFSVLFREDLWNCALENCGYNIADFRRLPRPAIRPRPCCFTRKDFENL